LHYLIKAANIGLGQMILFSCKNCAFLQQFAADSTIEVKQKLFNFKQQSSCRAPTLARSSVYYWNGMGMTAMFQYVVQSIFYCLGTRLNILQTEHWHRNVFHYHFQSLRRTP